MLKSVTFAHTMQYTSASKLDGELPLRGTKNEDDKQLAIDGVQLFNKDVKIS